MGTPPGAEAFDDLIRLILSDLDQVIRRFVPLPFDDKRRELPAQVSC